PGLSLPLLGLPSGSIFFPSLPNPLRYTFGGCVSFPRRSFIIDSFPSATLLCFDGFVLHSSPSFSSYSPECTGYSALQSQYVPLFLPRVTFNACPRRFDRIMPFSLIPCLESGSSNVGSLLVCPRFKEACLLHLELLL
ncbi:hypothetical protein FOZ62_011532, partial [Perkinsus olseni]